MTPKSDSDRTLTSHEVCTTLSDHGPWEKQFTAQVEDLEGWSW